MLADLRHGLRVFSRRPVLMAAAVISLGVGIGANTAIFSVLYGAILKPLPYEEPDRLVVVWETQGNAAERWVAPANFVDWRKDTTAFAALAAFDEFSPTVVTAGEPERLRAVSLSGSFFPLLGATAALGRTLLPTEDEPGAPDAVVLSHGAWIRLFAAAPDILGRPLALDGRTHTIVGVMPPDFAAPMQRNVDVWVNGDRGVPRTFPFGGDLTAVRDAHVLTVIGRLNPGVGREAAQAELSALMARLSLQYPQTNAGLGVNVKSLHDVIAGPLANVVGRLQLAVAVMLLIACANVAHLLLGQAAARQDEMATRMALGAGRMRLVRQLLAEAMVIAMPGGVLGLLLAAWGLEALLAQAPASLPRVQEIGLHPVVLVFTGALTLLTAAVFAVAPAWRAARVPSYSGGTRVAGARHVRRWQHAIVVTELALTYVLLIGAGLLIASLAATASVPLGFAREGRVAADLSLAPDRYLRPAGEQFRIDPRLKLQFIDRVLQSAAAAPGVRAVAAAFTAPLDGAVNRGFVVAGQPPKPAGLQDAADFQLVSVDYFRTLGTELVQGRTFTRDDRLETRPVAVVNRAFATRYLADRPIGARIRFGNDAEHEVVGVVGDMRYRNVESAASPTFYVPVTQSAERWPFLSFTVWADHDERGVAALRAAIRDADPAQAITRIRAYDDILRTSLEARTFNTVLVAAFAAAALLLAAIGTYGVMAHGVSLRTRELGVRAALGATPRGLIGLVLGDGVRLIVVATAIGLGAALVVTAGLDSLLYAVGPRDVRTFAVVTLVMTVVALLASYIPVRRLNRMDAVGALRDAH